jgi:hypothetical protein
LEEQSQAKSNKAKMPTTLTNRSILAVNLLGARHTGFTFVVAAQQAVHTSDFGYTANQLMLWASAHS